MTRTATAVSHTLAALTRRPTAPAGSRTAPARGSTAPADTAPARRSTAPARRSTAPAGSRTASLRRSTALHRAASALLAFGVLAVLALAGAAPAQAYAPVDIVHTEQVQAGPYTLTVGFSTWPIRAMRSLDFTFAPDGGIEDKTGTFAVIGPSGSGAHPRKLVRHPRLRQDWGLDVRAIDKPGTYRFAFAIDGPLGHGEGALPAVQVLDQPGPPLALSWSIALLPLLGMVVFLGVAWRRIRPASRPLRV